MKISKTTRQDIIDYLKLEGISWGGKLDDTAFLERIFDLQNMPSHDSRYDNALGDIWQHRQNNNDWEDDWVFTDTRFKSLWDDDEVFLRFLCEVLHPVVRNNPDETQKLKDGFNQLLSKHGYEIVERTRIASQPVFAAQEIQTSKIRILEPFRLKFFASIPSSSTAYPCVVLKKDNWDDFNYKTTFKLEYYDRQNHVKFSDGIKILKKGDLITTIPKSFEQLSADYCSLGQTVKFYKNLLLLGVDIYGSILTALNDVVYNHEIAEKFENLDGFTTSLLRFSEAEKAFKEAGNLFAVSKKKKNFTFQFRCTVSGAQSEHIIDFDFSPDKTQLHRITAIIGKNGTGKTQVLANFANSMSGLKLGASDFSPERPNFSKAIAISYSVFDEFDRPSETSNTFSYKYCGIRVMDNLLSSQQIRSNLESEFSLVVEQRREARWSRILGTLLNRDNLDRSIIWDSNNKLQASFYNQLSSGQRILVLVMTEVIAHISPESIILFDEPEIHLHPDALSALARSFHLLLDEFDSYAIIATHSPILLQEIPSKYVRVFDRQGDYPIVSPLGIESFGENLTTITDDVFETTAARNNFREHLAMLAESHSYEEILAFFDGKLGLNARTYLKSLDSKAEIE